MDIFQFLASVIGSIAWPLVVVYLLFLVRIQLGPLVRRLTELSFPGGGKAVFQAGLENAQQNAITIEKESTIEEYENEELEYENKYVPRGMRSLPSNSPEIRIMKAYNDVEML